MCCNSQEAPEPTNPAIPLTLDAIFTRPTYETPYSRQEQGRYVEENGQRVWKPYSAQDFAAAIAQGFRDPKNPDFSALSGILSAEQRTIEDPRVRAMRERQQETDDFRRQIGNRYLEKFNDFLGTRTMLPPSQYGLPQAGPIAGGTNGGAPIGPIPVGGPPNPGLPVGTPGGTPPGGGVPPGGPPPPGGPRPIPPGGGGGPPGDPNVPNLEKLFRMF